jgi:hypothetical protein
VGRRRGHRLRRLPRRRRRRGRLRLRRLPVQRRPDGREPRLRRQRRQRDPDADDPPGDGIDQDCREANLEPCPDEDGDGYCPGVDDCDDADPTVYLGAPEVLNCVDDDCNGQADQGLATWDNDRDGACVGADLGSGPQCCDPGEVPGDCDDTTVLRNLLDLDGDGVDTCGPDGLPDSGDEDCDDFDDDNRPGAPELCDGEDNDCDGVVPPDEADDDGDGVRGCEGDCDDADATVGPWDLDFDGASPCQGDCDDADPALRPQDLDGDTVSSCDGDCDDLDPSISPLALEICNDVDDDCDGSIAASDVDADADGWPECDDCDDADPLLVGNDEDGDGSTVCAGDCDDADITRRPGYTDVVGDGIDQNCDGMDGTDGDADGFASTPSGGDDCDDADPAIHPGAVEICDDIDGDCDGDADSTLGTVYYPDGDGDGWGLSAPTALFCFPPASGYAAQLGDCDDVEPTTFPGAPEVCDGVDSNCDAVIDTDIDTIWFRDLDADTFGDPSVTDAACAAPPGYVADDTDCDDNDVSIFPGAPDPFGDGVDQDCDGVDGTDADADGAQALTAGGDDCDDADPDRFPGNPDTVGDAVDQNCDGIDGVDEDGDTFASEASGGGDCDDQLPTVFPGAFEICDEIDSDCGGDADTALHITWYVDGDDDGYGLLTISQGACDQPAGYVLVFGDCEDEDPLVFPGAAELCNGIDDDCDLTVPADELDGDADTFSPCEGDCDDGAPSVYPHATEIPLDLIDQNCDGLDYCEDLNCDGWPDLVFGNQRVGPDFTRDSYIYYGSAAGFSAAARDALPTLGPGDLRIADLDGDGYMDIVFGSHYDGATFVLDSYVYYGGATGYSTAARTLLPTYAAAGVEIADYDNDGMLDIAFSCYGNGYTSDVEVDSYIYWGDAASGFTVGNRTAIPTKGAWGNAAGDIDGDGWVDLVIGQYWDNAGGEVASKIFWGTPTGLDLGSPDSLSVPFPYGVQLADLNGDDRLDIAFASYSDQVGWDATSTSRIFLFDELGHDFPTAWSLDTEAVSAASIGDFDADGDLDVFLGHQRSGGTVFERDSYVYRNQGGAGTFVDADRFALPTAQIVTSFAADLDLDGYTDLAVANHSDNAEIHTTESFVFWGSSTGLSAGDYDPLPTEGATGVFGAGPGIPNPRSTP